MPTDPSNPDLTDPNNEAPEGEEIVVALYSAFMQASEDYAEVNEMPILVACLSVFTTMGQMLAMNTIDPHLIYGGLALRFTELRDETPGQEVARIDALEAALRAAIAAGDNALKPRSMGLNHHEDRQVLDACKAILDGGTDVAALERSS